MNWFLAALKKYSVFQGRARRKEYWYFVLFYILIYAALSFIEGTFDGPKGSSHGGVLTGLFTLATLVPSLSVGVRRLHDTSRSGWWLLLGLIPIVGALILIYFTVHDSDPGDNRFGPNPKTDNDAGSNSGQWGSVS